MSPWCFRIQSQCHSLWWIRAGPSVHRRQSTHSTRLLDVEKLLEAPRHESEPSPFPTSQSIAVGQTVTAEKLRHLLRLSALPPPKDAAEEARILADLTAQLCFVREIQRVETTGVAPLTSLRDETAWGIEQSTIGLEQVRDVLASEELKGSYHKKIRRRRSSVQLDATQQCDALGQAKRKVGRYLVVDRPR